MNKTLMHQANMRAELKAAPKTPNLSPAPSVLVIDDDVELCELISQYLRRQGFAVECVNSGSQGVQRSLSGEHTIVILDVMLPDLMGFEVLKRIRTDSQLPILMLTARGNEQDRILGLEMGADDYLAKPFNPRELLARMEAILRRAVRNEDEQRPGSPERIVVDDVELEKGTRTVWRSGQLVDLTTVEFDLLETMLRAAGRVLSREEMVRSVLNREFSPFDRSIDTHVSNLRRKLGRRTNGRDRIKGVRGVGYLYALAYDADENEG